MYICSYHETNGDQFDMLSYIGARRLFRSQPPVMWSEAIGLRTRPVETKKKSVLVLDLVLQVWCCETQPCHARCHNDLEGHTATFQVLFIVSLFWSWSLGSWNITTVEINSGVHLLKKLNPPSAFVYSRWSWSCYFGNDNDNDKRLGLTAQADQPDHKKYSTLKIKIDNKAVQKLHTRSQNDE